MDKIGEHKGPRVENTGGKYGRNYRTPVFNMEKIIEPHEQRLWNTGGQSG